jgi:K+-transporting ATPase KdpF subunit
VRPDLTLATLGVEPVLYLTAVVTVAALIYLVYAMIRPERF